MVVGMSSKFLSIKYRLPKLDSALSLPSGPPRGGSYRYFMRGKSYRPATVGHVTMNNVCVCVTDCDCRKSMS